MLFSYRVFQMAQCPAINMGLLHKLHRRAFGRVEHPSRYFDEHRIDWRFTKSAQVRHISVGTASLARQDIATIPTVPSIADLPGFKGDTVGFLQRDCITRR